MKSFVLAVCLSFGIATAGIRLATFLQPTKALDGEKQCTTHAVVDKDGNYRFSNKDQAFVVKKANLKLHVGAVADAYLLSFEPQSEIRVFTVNLGDDRIHQECLGDLQRE